jgi:peptidyl-prolyl cis-trans isomerase SurA
MTRLPSFRRHAVRWTGALLAAWSVLLSPAVQAQPAAAAPRTVDYIVAVVDQELVTNSEVQQRLQRIEQEAERNGARLPPRDELRAQVVEALINERAQLSYAKLVGLRIDEAEIDRAVNNVAAQNQLTLPQLRERLREQGMDFARFRNNIRDELLLVRLREREVQRRIKISDAEIEDYLRQLRAQSGGATEYDIAQILIAVPEGATPEQEAELQQRAQQVLEQARAGTPFEELVRSHSQGPNRDQGAWACVRPTACPTCSCSRWPACRPARWRRSWCAPAPASTSSSWPTARTARAWRSRRRAPATSCCASRRS